MVDNDSEKPTVSGPAVPPDPGDYRRPDPLSPGDVIDGFEILSVLGRGGMGVVYRASEKALRRVVALKALYREIAENDSVARRFRREAILAANLRHPNIVPVFHIDDSDSPSYFTMEFVEGQSLREKMKGSGPIRPVPAVKIALQVAEALHYAHHEKDIIHRDIKPGNSLLDGETGRVRVTDFGIAQDMTGDLAEVTQTATFIAGTTIFMSPEQNLGWSLDGRTDVFSLGVTLYYMLTYDYPFRARSPQELALAHRSKAPRPLAEYWPDIPDDLDRIVRRMIHPDVDLRYPTAEEAAQELREWLGAHEETAEKASDTREPTTGGRMRVVQVPLPDLSSVFSRATKVFEDRSLRMALYFALLGLLGILFGLYILPKVWPKTGEGSSPTVKPALPADGNAASAAGGRNRPTPCAERRLGAISARWPAGWRPAWSPDRRPDAHARPGAAPSGRTRRRPAGGRRPWLRA